MYVIASNGLIPSTYTKFFLSLFNWPFTSREYFSKSRSVQRACALFKALTSQEYNRMARGMVIESQTRLSNGLSLTVFLSLNDSVCSEWVISFGSYLFKSGTLRRSTDVVLITYFVWKFARMYVLRIYICNS